MMSRKCEGPIGWGDNEWLAYLHTDSLDHAPIRRA